jgi:hypothetical protein
MTHEMTAELKERLHYSAIWFLEKGEYSPLTDEEKRSVKTFYTLEESVDEASATVIEHMLELNEKHPELFELGFLTMVARVSDKFRPATASEFVGSLNDFIHHLVEKTKCPKCGEQLKPEIRPLDPPRFHCGTCGFSAVAAN